MALAALPWPVAEATRLVNVQTAIAIVTVEASTTGALIMLKARLLNRVTEREPALMTVLVCNSAGGRHPRLS